MAVTVNPKIAAIISADVTQLVKGVNTANSSLKTLESTARTVNSALQAFGVGLGLYALAEAVKYSVRVMAEFEQTMSTLKAVTGATGSEFQRLENDAIALAGVTRYTANEIGQLQVIFARFGFTSQEVREATEATLMLAQATGEDLSKAADTAAATIRGFQLDASETGRVADVMASALNKSALSLDTFTEAMKYVAPIANAAGATVEETAAMLSTLADAGVRGSMAGTSLRKIFTDLSKDGRPLKERLQELADKGITLKDSFDEVGRTAQTALLILSKNTEKTNELTKAYQNSSGELKKMSDIMMDNLLGDTAKLTASWQQFLIVLSSSEALRTMTQLLTQLVNFLGKNRPENELRKIQDQRQAYQDVVKELNKYKESAQFVQVAQNRLNAILGETEAKLDAVKRELKETEEQGVHNSIEQTGRQAKLKRLREEELILVRRYNNLTNEGNLVIKEMEEKRLKRLADEEAAQVLLNQQISIYGRLTKEISETEDLLKLARTTKQADDLRIKLAGLREELERTFGALSLKIIPDLGSETNMTNDMAATQQSNFSKMLDEMGHSAEMTGGILLSTLVPAIDNVNNSLSEMRRHFSELSNKEQFDVLQENWINFVSNLEMSLADLRPLIVGLGVDIAEALAADIGGGEKFGHGLLRAVGNFMTQLGKQMVALGIALLLFKGGKGLGQLLKNPFSLIAGGIALMAASGAITKTLNQGISGSGGGGGRGAGGGASGSFGTTGLGEGIILTGDFELQGYSLQLLLDRQTYKNGRIGG